jgi:tetratricopeptide (TPR) repeat protein
MDQWLDYSDFLDKTQELIDLGLYEEAKALLEQHEHSFPDEWEIFFLHSRICAEQNQPEQAIVYLKKALLYDPENVDCLTGIFYAYAMMNEPERGGSYLLDAEKLHPDHELVLSALVWYYTETNRLTTAISYFERIKSKGTTNPETFRNGGIAYDRAGDPDKAIECFKAALDLHHSYDEVRELLSDLYIATEKPVKAAELYREALAESPQNIRYLSRLTYCLTQNNEIEKAIETAESSIKLYPNSPIGHIDLAYAHLNNNDLDKALAAAEKALDVAPLDAESFRVKAIILSDQEKNDEAEKCFETAASLDKDNIEILRDYYNHLRRRGNDALMEEVISRVIARNDPSCVEDYWFLTDYYKEKKEYLKALHYLRKAYKIRPGEHDLLSVIADICLATGHPRYALKFIGHYVARAGWNDFMSQMAEYPELQDKNIQEGLRFFRFYGGRSSEFRRYLFLKKFRKFSLISLNILMPFAALLLLLIIGKQTKEAFTVFLVALAAAMTTVNIAVQRWGGKLFGSY